MKGSARFLYWDQEDDESFDAWLREELDRALDLILTYTVIAKPQPSVV